MELLPEDRQPKNSYRYGFKNGDAGIESVYIKRSVFKGAPPKNITVSVDEAD
jgi:hypothetical protein